MYAASLHAKRAAAKARYAVNPAAKRTNAQNRYQAQPHVFRAAVKAYYEHQKDTVNLYHRGKYNLKESKAMIQARIKVQACP